MGCTLCTPSGDIVFEDAAAVVVLHDDWAVLGHAMIVAKQHVENPSGLALADWIAFTSVWHRTEEVLLRLTGAERCIAMKLGVLTPHLHVHLYPVSSGATREEIFAAIDMKTSVPRDGRFVATLREHLTPATP